MRYEYLLWYDAAGRSVRKKSLRGHPLCEQAALLGWPPPGGCPRVAKLSVFGVGMKSHTSVASRLFTALASERINVDLISTTEVRVNVIVDGAHGERARAALLREFADAMG